MFVQVSRFFVVLFFAVASVILIVDYFYSQTESKRSFEQDVLLIWNNVKTPLDSLKVTSAEGYSIIPLKDLAWPESQVKSLKSQGYLILESSSTKVIFHGYLAKTDRVYVVDFANPEDESEQAFWWLMIYGALAGVIFLWLYPLIRDINELQNAAIEFGKNKKIPVLKANTKSAVYPIVAAFSEMSQRINRLISLQRDITTFAWHDIRTPLSRIRFASELIDDPASQKLKSDIGEEINEIEDLLKELLLYSEFEYTKPALTLQTAELSVVSQQVIDKFVSISAIQIDNMINENIVLTLDIELFKRALANLIGNCLRYADENIWLSFADNDEYVCVVVEDDGPGIDTNDMRYITSPFVRNSNNEDIDSDNSNSGLGLAIVETICQWHGGVFKVGNSVERKGARFVMQWPRALKQ